MIPLSDDDDGPRMEPMEGMGRGRGRGRGRRQPRGRTKRPQLSDSYPEYLQEAFFGRDLIDASKEDADEGLHLLSDPELDDQGLSRMKSPGLGTTPLTSPHHGEFAFPSSPARAGGLHLRDHTSMDLMSPGTASAGLGVDTQAGMVGQAQTPGAGDMASEQQGQEDSDKEHHIGNGSTTALLLSRLKS